MASEYIWRLIFDYFLGNYDQLQGSIVESKAILVQEWPYTQKALIREFEVFEMEKSGF